MCSVKTKNSSLLSAAGIMSLFRYLLVLAAAIFFFLIANASAQSPVAAPKPPSDAVRIKRPPPIVHDENLSSEKSIAASANVNIKMCAVEGVVKVNGWDRNEVRVFVSGGNQVGFKVLDKKNDLPVWLSVYGADSSRRTTLGNDCLSGDEIELDVPRGATLNLVGQENTVLIDSIKKVKIEIVGGSISIANVAQGVAAKTRDGSIVVRDSGGAINLQSVNGSLTVFETEANEIGDIFTAKTINGSVRLQNVGHRQMEVGSIAGSLRYEGAFASGGQYSFNTTSGIISLLLPLDTSCAVKASYGGYFQSEIPLKNRVVSSPSPQTKNLTGIFGDGIANLNLTTYTGAISIRKK